VNFCGLFVFDVSGTLELRSALEDDFEEEEEDKQGNEPMEIDEPNGHEKVNTLSIQFAMSNKF
jgi:pre-mRNA-splicing factor 38A